MKNNMVIKLFHNSKIIHFLGIKSEIYQCTVKRIGDLPFGFSKGTCGTFLINSLPTILLCFDSMDIITMGRRCRSLTRRNDGPLSIKDFVFDAEFEVKKVAVPVSAHTHWMATMANYLGLPIVLGGSSSDWTSENNKLEILNTMETPLAWIKKERIDYPYSKT